MATLPKGYLRVPNELWTGFWTVPMDAPTGMVTYTVTANSSTSSRSGTIVVGGSVVSVTQAPRKARPSR